MPDGGLMAPSGISPARSLRIRRRRLRATPRDHRTGVLVQAGELPVGTLCGESPFDGSGLGITLADVARDEDQRGHHHDAVCADQAA